MKKMDENRTHCKQGHLWIEKNISRSNSKNLKCKKCIKISTKRYFKNHPWIKNYWAAKKRCVNKNHIGYSRYGGRGIKFLITMKEFKYLWFRDEAYLMEKPSIDRIDNNGHYELSNCRFIEMKLNSSRNVSGESNYKAKFKMKQVLKIRELFKRGIKQCDLIKKFNCSSSCIYGIVHNKTYKESNYHNLVRGKISGEK